jgi:aminopeptidase N
MDEGMAVFLPYDFQERETGRNIRARDVQNYISIAGDNFDVPIITPSIFLRGYHYRILTYDKPAIAYNFLFEFLGEELFNKTLRELINRWNGKHPTPYDFFFTFNDVVGKDLSWFWKPWFFEFGYPDLGIKDLEVTEDKIRILIEKKGNIPVSINLILTFQDNSEAIIYKAVSIWESGDKEVWIEQEVKAPLMSVRLGSEKIPDTDNSNNFYEKK